MMVRHVHLHTFALDGVFAETPKGALTFEAAPALTDDEVARLLATIHRRVSRLLRRRGLLEDIDDASTQTRSPRNRSRSPLWRLRRCRAR